MVFRRILAVFALLVGGVSALVAVPVSPAVAADGCNISAPNDDFSTLVDGNPQGSQVWRLYQAAFLRQPDLTGYDHWNRVLASGSDLVDIAATFTDGPEFRSKYGAIDNREFVRRIYQNVLCRNPETAGWDAWTSRLDQGALSRNAMLVQFSEGPEYLNNTDTCHSDRDVDPLAIPHCSPALSTLASARLADDGYQSFTTEIARQSVSGTGTFSGVLVDLDQGLNSIFSTGHNRCGVASINANWVDPYNKDGYDPGALGIGVVDGAHVKGSANRDDRGVLGVSAAGSADHGHVLVERGGLQLTISQDFRPTTNSGWIWAAAGLTLAIEGEIASPYVISPGSGAWFSDSYTHHTYNHSFVAVDRDSGRLLFGATSEMKSMDFVVWALAKGYDDVIKYDGGGSTEFNVGGEAIVAGTSRDLPVWLGIGC